MAMVGRPPEMEDVFPGYGQRRREGIGEVLQQALLMLINPAVGGLTATDLVKRRSRGVLSKLRDLKLMNRPEIDDFIGVRERSINRALRDLVESKGNVGAEADVNSWLRQTMRDVDRLRKGATIRYD